jgi:hypothetical protein
MVWIGAEHCKTVGSAYVGSNPTPATTCGNGPLAAETRPRGCFRSCHVAYQSVSLCVEVSRCPRTYSGRRPGRLRGRGHRRLSTDGPGKRGLVPAQVRCRCHAPPDGRHRPGRAGAAAAEGRAVRQTVASAARRVSGQLLYWRGCPSRTVLTERDSPRPARRSPSSLPIRAPSQMPGVTSLCTPREPALEDNQPWHSGARVLGHAASTMVIRRAERAAGCRPS